MMMEFLLNKNSPAQLKKKTNIFFIVLKKVLISFNEIHFWMKQVDLNYHNNGIKKTHRILR